MKLDIRIITVIGVLLFISTFSNAQTSTSDEDFGSTFKEKYALLSDGVRMKDYKNAVEPLNWLLAHEDKLKDQPQYHKNVYVYAIKIYSNLYRKATKEKKKEEEKKWQDKLLEAYENRVKNNFEKDDPIDLKLTQGKYLYSFKKDRKDFNKKEVFDFYDGLVKEAGDKTDKSNLTYYMVLSMNLTIEGKNMQAKEKNLGIKIKKAERDKNAAAKSEAKQKLEKLKNSENYKTYVSYDEDWMLDQYDFISSIIENNIKDPKTDDKATWEDTKTKIDGLLPSVVEITCDFVKEKYGDELKNNPDNLEVAKKALKYMLQAKCTDDPLFIFAARNVFSKEPTGGLASVLSDKHLANNDLDSAIIWKKKAIDLLDEDPLKQAESYLKIAKIYAKKSQRSASRSNALKAAELDPQLEKEAYTLVGDLYLGSGSICNEGDPVQQAAIYLAAYDMYAKAGDRSKMATAQKYFPAMTDIFTLADKGYEKGKQIKVGCWINTTTTIRVRPK